MLLIVVPTSVLPFTHSGSGLPQQQKKKFLSGNAGRYLIFGFTVLSGRRYGTFVVVVLSWDSVLTRRASNTFHSPHHHQVLYLLNTGRCILQHRRRELLSMLLVSVSGQSGSLRRLSSVVCRLSSVVSRLSSVERRCVAQAGPSRQATVWPRQQRALGAGVVN